MTSTAHAPAGQLDPPIRRALRSARRRGRGLRRSLLTPSSSGELRALQGQLADVSVEVGRLRAALATATSDLRRGQEDAAATSSALELLLGADTARTSRLMSRVQIRRLSEQVGALTGSAKPHANVVAAFRTMVDLEQRGLGRVAGSASNVVGKLATTPLLGPPTAEVLEIGTLFGLFAAGLHRQLARKGWTASLTVVDPFATMQLQAGHESRPDPTGTPVSVEVATANLALAGVPAEQVRLIQGFSTDHDVRARVADRRYGVVVVDGDHSAAGVAADLDWVHDLVEPGGIVVLDDFGDPAWPGVQQATLDHLARRPGLTMLGTVSTSAFLRRHS